MPIKKFQHSCEKCSKVRWIKDQRTKICVTCHRRNVANQAAVVVNKLKPRESAYRALLKGKRSVSITYEQFLAYSRVETCFYCESKINWKTINSNLDRRDNSKNYTVGNVVVCCTKCNKTRMNNFSVDEFKGVVKLIKTMRNGDW